MKTILLVLLMLSSLSAFARGAYFCKASVISDGRSKIQRTKKVVVEIDKKATVVNLKNVYITIDLLSDVDSRSLKEFTVELRRGRHNGNDTQEKVLQKATLITSSLSKRLVFSAGTGHIGNPELSVVCEEI